MERVGLDLDPDEPPDRDRRVGKWWEAAADAPGGQRQSQRSKSLLSQQLLSSGEEDSSRTSPVLPPGPATVKFACDARRNKCTFALEEKSCSPPPRERREESTPEEAPGRITADGLIRKDIALADSSEDEGFASDNEHGVFSTPSESSFTSESIGPHFSRHSRVATSGSVGSAEIHIEEEADLRGLEGDTFALDEQDADRSDYCLKIGRLRPVTPSDIDPSFPSSPPSGAKSPGPYPTTRGEREREDRGRGEREGDVIARGRSLPVRRRLCCPAIKIRVKKTLDQSL